MLEKVLPESVLIAPKANGNIELQESDSHMKVAIIAPTSSATFVCIDPKFHKFHLPVLRDGPWKQICDYLVVFEAAGQHHAVFIELKKTLRDDAMYRPKNQLLRSLPILKYLQSLCEINSEPGQKDTSCLSIHYCLIGEKYHARFDKQPIRGPKSIWEIQKYRDIVIKSSVSPQFSLADLINP